MSQSGQRFIDIEVGDKRLPVCSDYHSWKLLSLKDAMTDVADLLPGIQCYVTTAIAHCTYPNQHDLSKDEAAALYLYTMEMSEESSPYRLLTS